MIYFATPDEQQPYGGIKVIYKLVDILNDADFEAAVWHGTSGFRARWFGGDTRIVNGKDLLVSAGDVVVVPEVGRYIWAELCAGIPLVVLNQGHFHTFDGLSGDASLLGRYPGAPTVAAAIATSCAVEVFLRAVTPSDFPVHRIPVPLDMSFFYPREKELMLAWMPRRRRRELHHAVEALRRRGLLDGWKFVPIAGMEAHQVADVLGRASIFLFGGEAEGFGLPGVEAMASGAYTIGFPAGGGAEWAMLPLCTPISDGDAVAMIHAVEQHARLLVSEPSDREIKTQQTRQALEARYGDETVRAATAKAFTEISQPGSASLVSSMARVRHQQVVAERERRSLRRRINQLRVALSG